MIQSMTIDLLRGDDAYASVRVTMTGDSPPILDVSADPGRARVLITDTGPGIPPEIRSRLFTPFVTTKARGTGLGLSTVKRLIEAHHGEIRVDSLDSGGARPTLWLPLA